MHRPVIAFAEMMDPRILADASGIISKLLIRKGDRFAEPFGIKPRKVQRGAEIMPPPEHGADKEKTVTGRLPGVVEHEIRQPEVVFAPGYFRCSKKELRIAPVLPRNKGQLLLLHQPQHRFYLFQDRILR